jgi:hypothetical protein
MRKVICASLASALLLVSVSAFAELKNYKASLDDIGSAPDPAGTPTGTALFTFDTATKTFCGRVTYTTLSGPVTKTVLVEAPATTLKELQIGTSPINVNTTLTDAQVQKIDEGNVFITLQTKAPYTTNTNGEIHGILEADTPGTAQTCTDGGTDAGTDASTGSSSGTSGTSGNDDPPPLAPPPNPTPPKKDDGGCATVGATLPQGSELALAAVVGLVLGAITRRRRR